VVALLRSVQRGEALPPITRARYRSAASRSVRFWLRKFRRSHQLSHLGEFRMFFDDDRTNYNDYMKLAVFGNLPNLPDLLQT
jgi:hypothetical protein